MDLIADRGRRVAIEELNTTRLLAHARKQALKRKLDDVLIVDVDSHHYENEHYKEVYSYIESPVVKMEAMESINRGGRSAFLNNQVGYIALSIPDKNLSGMTTPMLRSNKNRKLCQRGQ